MYQGGSNGHFTSLLIPNFKGDEFRKLTVTSHNQCYQILFEKPSAGLWEPIASIFPDLSISDYIAKKLPKIEICLPSIPADVVVVESQDNGENVHENVINSPLEGHNDQQPNVNDGKKKKNPHKCDKLVEKVSIATRSIETLCDRADTFSMLPMPSDPKALKIRLDDVNDICTQLGEISASVAERELQTLLRSHESDAAVANKFRLVITRTTAVTSLRDKLREPQAKQPSKKNKGSKTSPALPTGPTSIDFMLRVKSDFAADDVNDQVEEGTTVLLSFLHVIPIPASLVSFYYSLIHASSCDKIRAEMEKIFKSKVNLFLKVLLKKK